MPRRRKAATESRNALEKGILISLPDGVIDRALIAAFYGKTPVLPGDGVAALLRFDDSLDEETFMHFLHGEVRLMIGLHT